MKHVGINLTFIKTQISFVAARFSAVVLLIIGMLTPTSIGPNVYGTDYYVAGIEDLMCAVQERYTIQNGSKYLISFPINDQGISPGSYPSPGFYRGMSESKLNEAINSIYTNTRNNIYLYIENPEVIDGDDETGSYIKRRYIQNTTSYPTTNVGKIQASISKLHQCRSLYVAGVVSLCELRRRQEDYSSSGWVGGYDWTPVPTGSGVWYVSSTSRVEVSNQAALTWSRFTRSTLDAKAKADLTGYPGSGVLIMEAGGSDSGPVFPDGKLHVTSHNMAGNTVATSGYLNSDYLPFPETPNPPSGQSAVSQIGWNGFVIGVLIQAQFKYPIVPIQFPNNKCPAPLSTCDQCPTGTASIGNSLIDNTQFAHFHTATDWTIPSAGGCTPCGGGTSAASPNLPTLKLDRVHRYKDQDWRGSFGPGVFLGYDSQLEFDKASNTARFFDPNHRFAYDLTDATNTGVYTDTVYNAVTDLRIYDASSVATNDESLARTAVVTMPDGQKQVFQVFTTDENPAVSGRWCGRLIRTEDRNGNAITLTYADADPTVATATLGGDRGRLWRYTAISDPQGRSATVTWTRACGQWVIATITTPDARTITYRYDTARLVGLNRVEFPNGDVASFRTQWNATSKLQEVVMDDPGAEGIHRRKTVGLTPVTLDGGLFNAQPPNRCRQVLNGAGETSYRNWIEANGAMTTIYVYEGGGESGGGTLLRMDTDDGAPRATWRALNFDLAKSFASFTWELVERNDVNGQMKPTKTVQPDGSYITYARNAAGEVVASTLFKADGTQVATDSTTRNAFNQPLVQTDRLGRVTECTYDPKGNLLTRIVGKNTADAGTWEYTYNTRGQVLTAKDANLKVTDYTYDANGRLTTITEPLDGATGTRTTRQFTYDSAGRIATSKDQALRTATYAYDTRGRLYKTTYGDSSTEELTFGTGTSANLVTRRKDRNGIWEDLTYDSAGRKISAILAKGRADQRVQTWTWLPGKELVQTQTTAGEMATFGYDHRLRLVTTTRYANAAQGAHVSTTVYDLLHVEPAKDGTQWEPKPYQPIKIDWALCKHIGQHHILTPFPQIPPAVAASALPLSGQGEMTIDDQGRRAWRLSDLNGSPIRTVRELVVAGLTLPADHDGQVEALLALARSTDPNPGYVIEDTIHDAAGQLVARIDGRGVSSTFSYDAQGRLTTQVEGDRLADGSINLDAACTTFTYDKQGNRLTVVKPRSFVRHADGSFATAPTGEVKTVSTYTGRNLLATVTEAFGTADAASITYTYSPTGKKATETDPRNAAWVTTYTYGTCCDRLAKVTDPAGYFVSYGYDYNGNLTSVTDQNGYTTSTAYDAQGRVKSRTNPVGETTTIAYDDHLADGVGIDNAYASTVAGLRLGAGADGSATLTTNPAGEISIEIRDGLGRTVRTRDAGGHLTTIAYDTVVDGLEEIAVTDALGKVNRRRSDAAGRVRQTVDALGKVATTSFDANGNAIAARDANGIGWDAQYDALNRQTRRTDTKGDAVQTAYDTHGNAVTVTDARGQATQHVYDPRDRKKTTTDRITAVTGFTYDKAGNLLTITDAEGSVTTYDYDNRGLLTAETYPAGQQTSIPNTDKRTYTYDAGRRLKTRLDQAGVTTTYNYDNANRLTGRVYSTGKSDGFTYDKASRLKTATSGRYGTTVTRNYNAEGLLDNEVQNLGAASYTVRYAYDAAHRTTKVTYPDNTVVDRSYTDRHQLAQVWYGGASVAIRGYDDGGRLDSTAYANGRTETRGYVPNDNQVQTITVPTVTAFTYAYDGNKRKTAETDGISAANSQSFGYDNADRMTAWSGAGSSQSWTLSPVGDWSATTKDGVAETREHTKVHETTRVTKNSVATDLLYDAKGNLTQDLNGADYTWDEENRLLTATVTDQTLGMTGMADYRYDALGRRLQKVVFGRATTFVHDGAQVIYEAEGPQRLPSSAVNDDGAMNGTPPGGAIIPDALVRVNFQPGDTPVPSGFVADKGKTLAARTNGFSYGWSAARSANAVVRGESPYPQFDTFNQNGTGTPPSGAGTWKLALANGTYAVALVMGDAASLDQTDNVAINGVAQTDLSPANTLPPSSSSQRGNFDWYLVNATVSDGYLTITVPTTAKNPKLCFIEVGKAGSTIDQAMRDRAGTLVGSANSYTGTPPFPPRSSQPRAYVYGSYVDEPLMLVVAGTKYYYHANHLYSVMAMTDAAGAVVEKYKYDAYGKRTVMSPLGTVRTTTSVGNWVGFTGYRLDEETGLYYARARMYSPGLGRFIGRDPFKFIPSPVSMRVYAEASQGNQQAFNPKQWRQSQPIAGDGYRDGQSLYAAYFAPNQVDPSGEKCEKRTLTPQPGHQPKSNGCGSGPTANIVPDSWPFFNGFGSTWVDFTPACDMHDICYGVCGSPKYDCDVGLEAQILSACHQKVQSSNLWEWQKKMVILQCQGVAAGYRYAVQQLGEEPFQQGQDEACKWECFDCKFYDTFKNAGVRVRRK